MNDYPSYRDTSRQGHKEDCASERDSHCRCTCNDEYLRNNSNLNQHNTIEDLLDSWRKEFEK